ncbi:MAG: hypothetical protein H7124_12675 [Phycisphaerales bacterium]|nr:hypothetical protein [Hyphomonadaceae bacterium]
MTLPNDLIESLDEAVKTGEYTSRDEAVRIGIEALEADRLIERIGLDRVRQMWAEGLASPSKDAGPVFARLREKYRRVAQERKA